MFAWTILSSCLHFKIDAPSLNYLSRMDCTFLAASKLTVNSKVCVARAVRATRMAALQMLAIAAPGVCRLR